MTSNLDAHLALIQVDRIRDEAEQIRVRDGESAAQIRLVEASRMELDAISALALKADLAISPGGECLDPLDHSSPATKQLRSPTKVATTAAVERLNLIHNNGVFDLALDAAESVGATTAIEKMITHELAAAHKTAMDLLERCKEKGDPTGGDQEHQRCGQTHVRGATGRVGTAAPEDRRQPSHDGSARDRRCRWPSCHWEREGGLFKLAGRADLKRGKSHAPAPCEPSTLRCALPNDRQAMQAACDEEWTLQNARWKGRSQADARALHG